MYQGCKENEVAKIPLFIAPGFSLLLLCKAKLHLLPFRAIHFYGCYVIDDFRQHNTFSFPEVFLCVYVCLHLKGEWNYLKQ